MIELISVHVPKCAGTSVVALLDRMFASGCVYRDYGDRPLDPASAMNVDPDGFFGANRRSGFDALGANRAVHGHFHVDKYQALTGAVRVTFLRDPVDRLISHYFYWKGQPRHGHVLHDYVLDHSLDIEQFARLPLIRRVYTSVFFAGVDPAVFDFIGFHDRLAQDCNKLSRLFGAEQAVPVTNTTDVPHYKLDRATILSDMRQMARLREVLRDDIAFYDTLRTRAG